jgi:two-component system cell cycle response regulator CpdR
VGKISPCFGFSTPPFLVFPPEILAHPLLKILGKNIPPRRGPMKRNDFKILIAEDEPGVRKLYEKAFKSEGFEVVMAETGSQLLAELEENPFDLLITDMQMPSMSALEVLPIIRWKYPNLPVVVVSGHYVNMEEEFHRKGFKVDMFFTKPLSLNVLKNAVRKILRVDGATDTSKENALFD